jgi:hypothetical protein
MRDVDFCIDITTTPDMGYTSGVVKKKISWFARNKNYGDVAVSPPLRVPNAPQIP